ncbi:MAG: thermonuclease family protein [Planctomycetaceae bacterium]|nr:thermonuclease family protein [Planctomycetaceae bacterium]
MLHRSILCAVLVALLSNASRAYACCQSDATDGIWHPITAVLGGEEVPKTVRDGIVLKLSGDQYAVTVNGTPDKGRCVVDTTVKPSRITIVGTAGPNQGKTLLAIFEVREDGVLRVCYDLNGKEFPDEFLAPRGSTKYLVEYRKELPPGAEILGEVVGVPDGDVLELQTAEQKKFRVRLNGIDAPESEQPFGAKSKELLKQLVGGKTVRVVTQGEDRSGQIIGDVYLKGAEATPGNEEIHLNNHLVENGLAWHFVRFAPDNKTLASSEQRARDNKAGLWAEADPVAPWDWRRQQAEKRNDKK